MARLRTYRQDFPAEYKGTLRNSLREGRGRLTPFRTGALNASIIVVPNGIRMLFYGLILNRRRDTRWRMWINDAVDRARRRINARR